MKALQWRLGAAGILIVCLLLTGSSGRESDDGDDGISIKFSARANATIGLGFNYDFPKSPLAVSFDYPRGYVGFNIPLKYSPPKDVTSGLEETIGDYVALEPTATARQNANTSIRVDVPMLGGVCSFANYQILYFNYGTTLGGVPASESRSMDGDGFSMVMQGAMGVPLEIQLGWETMTWGYAYKVNDRLSFAFNLNRHIFRFDARAKVDIDLLMRLTVSKEDVVIPPLLLDYSLHSVIDGHYELETWTPTFAVKYWRFSLISRFGMDSEARGYLDAEYAVPFFVDPETFEADEFTADFIADNMGRLQNTEEIRVTYSTSKALEWEMPQAHTIMFDVVPDKLMLSYTKLFGKTGMTLRDPTAYMLRSDDPDNPLDTLDFHWAASADHFLMLHVRLWNSFLNLGVFSFDFDWADKENLLYNSLENLRFGKGMIMPVATLGANMGSKLQLLLEADIAPFPALKTGIVYYF